MSDIDDTKQPLLEHLTELRRRLLISLAALVAAFFLCLYFAKPIFGVLVQPLLAAGQGRLIYTDVFEAFFAEVKVALFAALMLCFPVFATHTPPVPPDRRPPCCLDRRRPRRPRGAGRRRRR